MDELQVQMRHRSAIAILVAGIAIKKKKRKCKVIRRWSVRPLNRLRQISGAYVSFVHDLRAIDTEWHFEFFRMSRDRIGRSTACSLIYKTCAVLWEILGAKYMKFPSTQCEWNTISDEFWQKWNFPNCLGAIDGKHIRIQAPKNCGSLFFNHKGFHSIVLLAICDANYRFTYIDVGGSGSSSDAGLFRNTNFSRKLSEECNPMNLPSSQCLQGSNEMAPFVFIGDEGFPLKSNLLRPYAGRGTGNLPMDRNIFNYRLSRARRTIENAFGILAARFKIFRKEMAVNPRNGIILTRACLILHNYLIAESRLDYVAELGEFDRMTAGAIPEASIAGSRSTVNATQVRDKFANYFCTEAGKVPWQETAVTVNAIL